MPQKRQGFTTMVDLAEFEKTTWAFLVNIKMTWQYDGMAYLFREAGIPLYGIDRGTTKMNHPHCSDGNPHEQGQELRG